MCTYPRWGWARSLAVTTAAAGWFLSVGGVAPQAVRACENAPTELTAASGKPQAVATELAAPAASPHLAWWWVQLRHMDCRKLANILLTGGSSAGDTVHYNLVPVPGSSIFFVPIAVPSPPEKDSGAPQPAQSELGKQSSLGDLLPKGTKLASDPRKNRILAFTSEKGFEILKELVGALDHARPGISTRVTRMVTSESDGPVIDPIWATPLFAVATRRALPSSWGPGIADIYYYYVNDLRATMFGLWRRPDTRITWETRIILPNGDTGTIGGTVPSCDISGRQSGAATAADPEAGLPFEVSLLPRLNGDGTITLYASGGDRPMTGSGEASPPNGSPLRPAWLPVRTLAAPLVSPGIRVENGDTIIVEESLSPADRRVPPDLSTPGSPRPTNPAPEPRMRALYFITCNVVDTHG